MSLIDDKYQHTDAVTKQWIFSYNIDKYIVVPLAEKVEKLWMHFVKSKEIVLISVQTWKFFFLSYCWCDLYHPPTTIAKDTNSPNKVTKWTCGGCNYFAFEVNDEQFGHNIWNK